MRFVSLVPKTANFTLLSRKRNWSLEFGIGGASGTERARAVLCRSWSYGRFVSGCIKRGGKESEQCLAGLTVEELGS